MEYTSISTTATNKETSIPPHTAIFWQWNLCIARLRIIDEEYRKGLIAERGKDPD